MIESGVGVHVRPVALVPLVSTQQQQKRGDVDMMSNAVLQAYLQRIGLAVVGTAPVLDEPLLRRIAGAQLARIPFENFDIHSRVPVQVEPAVIENKLITRGRGGICYELNGLLARALRTLGFGAHLVGAAVRTPDGLGLPLGHVAIVAGIDKSQWLVDVGFGGDAIVHALGESVGDGWDVRFPSGSAYRTEGVPRPLADFEAMAWWHSTSPRARFTGGIVCSVTEDGVRKTLSCSAGEKYRLATTWGSQRTVRALHDDEALEVLAREYGIRVSELPRPVGF